MCAVDQVGRQSEAAKPRGRTPDPTPIGDIVIRHRGRGMAGVLQFIKESFLRLGHLLSR